jgi:hypothetical protein
MLLGFSTEFENLMGTGRTSNLTKNVKKGQVLSALANCSNPETVEGFNRQTTATPLGDDPRFQDLRRRINLEPLAPSWQGNLPWINTMALRCSVLIV